MAVGFLLLGVFAVAGTIFFATPLRDLPDPDLIIRTSGELRCSNFLLWQVAYAEISVTPTLWPDFDRSQFEAALISYAGRQRRFGCTGEQVEAASTGSTGKRA